jgi:7,8-dihydropterin-6-yl-methyl-4-(beta-D-ribofuranosyl)aminobenzene 5'-phosphate synthase
VIEASNGKHSLHLHSGVRFSRVTRSRQDPHPPTGLPTFPRSCFSADAEQGHTVLRSAHGTPATRRSMMPLHREIAMKPAVRSFLPAATIFTIAMTGYGLLVNCTYAADPAPAGDRITVLYDAFGRDDSMTKDWGFSALVEVGGKRILFDTGNNADIFAHNTRMAGVDLTKLDFVVISHRHGDHMGGLNHLLAVNPDVRIYVPKENFGVFGASLPGTFYRRDETLPAEMRYFDGAPPDTLYFGTPWPQGEFTWVTESVEVAPGFHLILLEGSWGVDLDVMEISLAIDTPNGTVLVVGCSHPTIGKIVATSNEITGRPVHLLIGGLHLLPAKDEQTERIAGVLKQLLGVQWIAPDHCTGEPAFGILKKRFGERYIYAGVGTTVSAGSNPVAYH